MTRPDPTRTQDALGERATSAALASLPDSLWTVFHDVEWPGRGYANIDHVVVGPAGIFVIDTVTWAGDVRVSKDVLRHNGRSREKTVAMAADAGLAVARLTAGVDLKHVHPIICFSGDLSLAGRARDVLVCTTTNLVDLITSRPVVIDPSAVRETSALLNAQFRPGPDSQGRRRLSVAPVVAVTGRDAGPAAVTPAPTSWSRRRLVLAAELVVLAALGLFLILHPQIVSLAGYLLSQVTMPRS